MATTAEDIRQLRVDVARDVLKLLELDQITPRKMVYIGGMSTGITRIPSRRLQRMMLDDPPACEVCALGLVAISLVRLKNRFSGARLYQAAQVIARNELGEDWARIVEGAFELWSSNRDGARVRDSLRKAGSRDRARMIMEAVIETEGDGERLRDVLYETVMLNTNDVPAEVVPNASV